jgi:hypothetical protein
MKTILVTLLLVFSHAALAHNCPVLMKEIDAKLSSAQGVSQENMAKVKKLRSDGERFHKEGKHDDSMKALEQAKSILGA